MSLPWDQFPADPQPVPEPVPVPTPPVPVPPTWTFDPAPSPSVPPPDIVKADAASRSKRTLIQGLIFDVFAAVVATVAMLSGADPFVKETWVGFGILLIKSVVSAAISYFMRLRSTPTIRTKGEKLAIMPVPRPMLDNEK